MQPLPCAPYGLRTPERSLWIEGWYIGRRLASKHYIEIEAIASELGSGEKNDRRDT
jgi:hypothetical protein